MMAKSKLKKFLLVLAASATMTLASCDVDAELTDSEKEAPILVDADKNNPSIYNNDMEQIYDALVTAGDTNSEKVLNDILLRLAQSKYGSFYDTEETDASGKKTKTDGLWTLVNTPNNDEKIWSFAENHEIYKIYGDDGKVNKDLTIANVKDFVNTLYVTICKSFWNTVKNSSYQERNYFVEYLFYKAEKAELYDLKDDNLDKIKASDHTKLVEGHDTYEKLYETNNGYFVDGWIDTYQDYIERSILQSAYRKALVESYLISNNYGVLGRSYARKVQYIAIKDENSGDHLGSLYRLFHAYAKHILEATDSEIKDALTKAGLSLSGETVPSSIRDLTFLDSLYIGYFDDQTSDEYKVAEYVYGLAGFTKDTGDVIKDNNGNDISYPFYKETKYGKLIVDYRKSNTVDRWHTSESSTDFTSSNAYTKEAGLTIETNSIRTTNNVTQGWYTSSGLSDLASDFKTRLFKMNVANELDTTPNYDSVTKRDDGTYTTRLQADGKYYLMPETYDDKGADGTPYVLYDSSSTTWYIIRVDEAVKANKLVKTGPNYYDTIESTNRAGSQTANQIVWEIAGLIGDSDSYKKAANQHYVEEAAISYHDDTVYEYFEKTFPDLFD